VQCYWSRSNARCRSEGPPMRRQRTFRPSPSTSSFGCANKVFAQSIAGTSQPRPHWRIPKPRSP
jgi:hypothetical protein